MFNLPKRAGETNRELAHGRRHGVVEGGEDGRDDHAAAAGRVSGVLRAD